MFVIQRRPEITNFIIRLNVTIILQQSNRDLTIQSDDEDNQSTSACTPIKSQISTRLHFGIQTGRSHSLIQHVVSQFYLNVQKNVTLPSVLNGC